MIPVMMLIGISYMPIILVIVSTIIINNPPVIHEMGKTRLPLLPVSILEKCGTISPTHPIVPTKLTDAAVKRVEQIIAITLMSLMFAPRALASTAPMEKTSIHHDINKRMIIGGIRTTTAGRISSAEAYEKLPIVQ